MNKNKTEIVDSKEFHNMSMNDCLNDVRKSNIRKGKIVLAKFVVFNAAIIAGAVYINYKFNEE